MLNALAYLRHALAYLRHTLDLGQHVSEDPSVCVSERLNENIEQFSGSPSPSTPLVLNIVTLHNFII